MASILGPLREGLFLKYNGLRAGIHLSDLLCPRKTVYNRLQPKPIGNAQLYFFLKGRSVHDAAQTLATQEPGQYVAELEVWLKPSGAVAVVLPEISVMAQKKTTFPFYMEKIKAAGIDPDHDLQAHIDLYDMKNRFPIELKTTDKSNIDQPISHQAWQLKSYMALNYAEDGVIAYVMRNYKDPLKEFPLFMPFEMRREHLLGLIKERRMIDLALQNKNPALAKHIAMDEELNFMCNNCPYLDQCQDLRRAAGESLIRPLSVSKKGGRKNK
jgi:hypothetical protein